jgi:DNA-binding transcriptional LysR family regulator
MSILPSVRQLRIFVAVARLRSFSRAAELTHMSQSALSQAVVQTEKLLGMALFERTKRTVRLTPAGQQLLPKAERILANLEAAIAEARADADPAKGQLRIACVSLVGTRILPEAITIFRARYPAVPIMVIDDYVDRVVDFLKDGDADMAISSIVRADPAIAFQPILEETFYFVCALDHPLASKAQISWSDLAGVDLVGMPQSSGIRVAIDRARVDAGVFRDTMYQVGRITSVVEIVAQGGGASIVPALALTGSCLRQKIHISPMAKPELLRTVGLLTLKSLPLPPAADAFRDILVRTLRNKRFDLHPGLRSVVG